MRSRVKMDIFLWCSDSQIVIRTHFMQCQSGCIHFWGYLHHALYSLPPTHVPSDSSKRQSATVSFQETNCTTGPFSMSIVCILQRKRTWLCPHCPSPSVLTRENLQAKLKQKVRLCYMTVSSAFSQTEWATVEGCVRLHMCAEKDNLVLAGNKWLLMLCIVFGK